MAFCEHCGNVRGQTYSDGGTSWCKTCWASEGNICFDHPRYHAIKEPRLACKSCWRLFFKVNEGH